MRGDSADSVYLVELETKVAEVTPTFTIMEEVPTEAFIWLKVPTGAFTFKTLLRHYAKRMLTPR